MTLEPTEFATETQLWNAILRQFGTALPLPSGKAVLGMGDAPTGARSARISLDPDLALDFVLQDFPFARLTGVEITLAEVLALPVILSEGLHLAALESLRAALPPSLSARLQLPQAPGPVADHDSWLAVELDLGNGSIARGLIGGRRQDFVQALSRLFPAADGQGAGLPVELLAGLSVDVGLAIGEMALPVAAVQALGPGDVLLPEIRADRRQFQLGPREVLIDSPADPANGWTVKEIRMTDDATQPDAAPISLDEVPLTLRFVTEDRRIALSDLKGIGPGSLLPIEVTALEAGLPVRILANGATVGEGHLVRIDDAFAVRVARMAPKAR